ncbi:MAG TPA: hypothetical protein PLO53_03385 [Candidatus Hydrogenedentes bacterium]|nr:hypothetical protein [Candidatus Hydrogenedentota bacterium]
MADALIHRRQFIKYVGAVGVCYLYGLNTRGDTVPGTVVALAPRNAFPRLTARLRYTARNSGPWRVVELFRDSQPFSEQATRAIREHQAALVVGIPIPDSPEIIACVTERGNAWATVCCPLWQQAYGCLRARSAPLVWGCSSATEEPHTLASRHLTEILGWLMLAGQKNLIRRIDTVGNAAEGGLITGILFSDGCEVRCATSSGDADQAVKTLSFRAGSGPGSKLTFRNSRVVEDRATGQLTAVFADMPLAELFKTSRPGSISAVPPDRWVPWEHLAETAGRYGVRL